VRVKAPGARAWGAVVLVLVVAGLCAAVLLTAAHEVDSIRGDVCGWAKVHAQNASALPASPARAADVRSDHQLVTRLGC
jgi:hypothetical protein